MGMGRRRVRFQEEGREWRLPSLLYGNDLILCSELKEELRALVGHFAEIYRRGLKVNADKSKVMVLGGEEELVCEIHIDGG